MFETHGSTAREEFKALLDAIPQETRERLQEMTRELFFERTDGGLDFCLDDYLWQTYNLNRLGIGSLAEVLPVPDEYAAELRSALRIEA